MSRKPVDKIAILATLANYAAMSMVNSNVSSVLKIKIVPKVNPAAWASAFAKRTPTALRVKFAKINSVSLVNPMPLVPVTLALVVQPIPSASLQIKPIPKSLAVESVIKTILANVAKPATSTPYAVSTLYPPATSMTGVAVPVPLVPKTDPFVSSVKSVSPVSQTWIAKEQNLVSLDSVSPAPRMENVAPLVMPALPCSPSALPPLEKQNKPNVSTVETTKIASRVSLVTPSPSSVKTPASSLVLQALCVIKTNVSLVLPMSIVPVVKAVTWHKIRVRQAVSLPLIVCQTSVVTLPPINVKSALVLLASP